jgi:phospholipase C
VQHIVILMQENRSFDHYFGRLRGVRGFQDPRAVQLYGSGKLSLRAAEPEFGRVSRKLLPRSFRSGPVANDLGLAFIGDLPHAWRDAHQCWNNGRYDQWTRAKNSKNTMAYLQRSDIPYYYALATRSTVCDAYFTSGMMSTDPNRYYHWTGWCGQNGTNNPDDPNSGSTPGNIALVNNTGNGVPPLGPVVTNAEVGYNWRTYPERCSRRASRGRSTRTPASDSMPPAHGAGRMRGRTSATTAATRSCTSSSTRIPRRARRCTKRRAGARRSTTAARTTTARCSTSCGPTS